MRRIAEASSSVQHAALSLAYDTMSYWKVVRPTDGYDDDDDGDDGDGEALQVEELAVSEARELGCPTADDPTDLLA